MPKGPKGEKRPADVIGAAVIPVTVQANDAHIAALYADWREAESIWLKANRIADNTHMDGLRVDQDHGIHRGDRGRRHARPVSIPWKATMLVKRI